MESSDGDEIIVHEGVYHEEVSVDGFQNLTIKSAHGERVIFDGTQSVVNDLGGSWLLSGDGIHEVDLGVDVHLARVDLQNACARLLSRVGKLDLAIQTTRPQ